MTAQKQAGTGSRGSSKRRLGRGLSSLIPAPVAVETADPPVNPPAADPPVAVVETDARVVDQVTSSSPAADTVARLAIDSIEPNRWQPRQVFDEHALDALASSIKTAGVMQPILVRRGAGQGEDAGYELIAGERRWRAAQRAGLETIPAVIRDIDDRTAAEWSLIENLQREDLNVIDRAEAFRRLATEFGLTHQEIADQVGLNRASISNHLRLLDLDTDTLDAARTGLINMGHARALLALTNNAARIRVLGQAVRQGWSVRDIEREVKRLQSPAITPASSSSSSSSADAITPHMADLQEKLSEHFGTSVRIKPGQKKGAGRLLIEFYNIDQFEGIMERCGFALAE